MFKMEKLQAELYALEKVIKSAGKCKFGLTTKWILLGSLLLQSLLLQLFFFFFFQVVTRMVTNDAAFVCAIIFFDRILWGFFFLLSNQICLVKTLQAKMLESETFVVKMKSFYWILSKSCMWTKKNKIKK